MYEHCSVVISIFCNTAQIFQLYK